MLLAAIVYAAYGRSIAEGKKAAPGRPQAFIFSLATDRPQWDGGKRLMPGNRMPWAFIELTCQFAPETRNLPAGKATRYIGGKCLISFPPAGGAANYICRARRLRHGKARRGLWGELTHAGGRVIVNQTPADYESGANYELTAYAIDNGASAKAAIDFPPGAESLGWQGTESIRAFPLVRTEDAILLWIRADTGIRDGAIDAVATAKGKRRDWQTASAGGVQRPLSRVKTGRSSPDRASLY